VYVRCIKAHPSILLAHDDTLKTDLAYYDMTRVTLKTFTYFIGASSLSIDEAVTGDLPNRLLFAMVDNSNFLGAINTNPYRFRYPHLRDVCERQTGAQRDTDFRYGS